MDAQRPWTRRPVVKYGVACTVALLSLILLFASLTWTPEILAASRLSSATSRAPAPRRDFLCRDILVDGGFEAGPTLSSWLQHSSSGEMLIVPEAARTGQWGGRLGTATPGQDRLGHLVDLPTTTVSITLRLWWYMTTAESDHPWDKLEVTFLEEHATEEVPLATFTDADISGTWQLHTVDISHLSGQHGWLLMRATNDELNLTTWYVDDISILACQPMTSHEFLPLLLSF